MRAAETKGLGEPGGAWESSRRGGEVWQRGVELAGMADRFGMWLDKTTIWRGTRADAETTTEELDE
jgi:hypothetical protein